MAFSHIFVVFCIFFAEPADIARLMVDSIASPDSRGGVLLHQEIAESLGRTANADLFALKLIDAVEDDPRFHDGSSNQREAVYILAELLTRADVDNQIKVDVASQLFHELPTTQRSEKMLESIMPQLMLVEQPDVRTVLEGGIHDMLANHVSDDFVFAKCYELMAERYFSTEDLRAVAVDILKIDPSVEGLIQAINEGNAAELTPQLIYALTLYALTCGDWADAYASLRNTPTWHVDPLATATALLQAIAFHHPDVAEGALSGSSVWDPQHQASFDQWMGEFSALLQSADPAANLQLLLPGYAPFGHVNGMLWLVHKLDDAPPVVQTAFVASVTLFIEQEAVAVQQGLGGGGIGTDYASARESIERFTPDPYRALLPDGF